MFWRDLLVENPNVVVLLSTRESPEVWWDSFQRTIVQSLSRKVPADRPDWARRRAMNLRVLDRFTPAWREQSSAIAAYEQHNAEVRQTVPLARLIDWRPVDGWEPICSTLGLAVPAEAFPHENTTADFQARAEISPPDARAGN
jgi:Sulfotransferase domain